MRGKTLGDAIRPHFWFSTKKTSPLGESRTRSNEEVVPLAFISWDVLGAMLLLRRFWSRPRSWAANLIAASLALHNCRCYDI